MFLITGVIIAALFLVSTLMPFLSWTLPFYKIKKLENADVKTKVIANIVAIAAIAWVDVSYLATYIGVFCLIEALYYILKKYGKIFGEFDKIFITTLAVGSVICGYIYFNRVGFNIGFENLKNMYIQKTTFTLYEVDMAFKFMKDNFIYLIFVYVGMTVFLTNYFLNRENFINWKVSYLWLLPYVLLFFVKKYTQFNGIFIENLVEVFKGIYIMYFIKIVTGTLIEKIKKQSLCFVAGVFLALVSPEFAFIFGGLASGIKIKVVKTQR